MTRLLSQLDSNEAILQLYLAGELPEVDYQEVRQMLATDPALRRELEEIRAAKDAAYRALRDLDAVARPVNSPQKSAANIGYLISQWTEKRLRPATLVLPQATRAIPWWRYSLSAAAMLLFGYYVYTVYNIKPVTQLNGLSMRPWTQDPPRSIPGGASGEDDDEPMTTLPPPPVSSQELSADEKVALLSNSLEDSIADESPNLHLAELTAMIPSGGSSNDADASGNASRPSQQDQTGEQ